MGITLEGAFGRETRGGDCLFGGFDHGGGAIDAVEGARAAGEDLGYLEVEDAV